ncbi:MAG: lytic transglycosylase domain-containing protein [Nitrospirae bacterium]|nr:lytic transglycosylase domain-containing protein [Nitrospirota bacterium]
MARMLSPIMLLLLILLVPDSRADIYKYVDDNGVIYFTNVPEGDSYSRVMTEKKKLQTREDYNEIIQTLSSQYNIEPSLVKAMITVESNWNYNAVSHKGAMGLMQLMPSTAKDLEVGNPFDPEENIEGGIRYMRFLLDKFNDLPLALAAYNAGPRRVESSGGIPSITETKQYVKKVLSIYKEKTYNIAETRIYKVTLDDGTVLFTNTPFAYQNFKVSSF